MNAYIIHVCTCVRTAANGQSVIDVFDYGTLTFWHYPPWTWKIFRRGSRFGGTHTHRPFYNTGRPVDFLTNRARPSKYRVHTDMIETARIRIRVRFIHNVYGTRFFFFVVLLNVIRITTCRAVFDFGLRTLTVFFPSCSCYSRFAVELNGSN